MELRRVVISKNAVGNDSQEFGGWFHGWFQFREVDGKMEISMPLALVENEDDGQVIEVQPKYVKFMSQPLDPYYMINKDGVLSRMDN